MEITFNITLNEWDIEEIKEDFLLAWYEYNEEDELTWDFEEVKVNTNFLREKKPLEFIREWLDMWYSLEWDKNHKSYIITD